MTSEHTIPRIPAELIPLIDAAIPHTRPPRRLSPARLRRIRAALPGLRATFGETSGPYRRVLLVAALEHARAEAIV